MDGIPIISFRYHAKYGHFRKPYSNVSSLSYPFPPRTALAGLIGAVLGISKSEVPVKFGENNLKVAVEIEKPIKSFTHVTNLRKDGSGGITYSVKRSKKAREQLALKNAQDWNNATQIPQEVLRFPSYKIYINLKDNMDELVSRIKEGRFVYTPCMGLSSFLADLEYISEGIGKQLDSGEYEVSTVTNKSCCTLSLNRLNVSDDHHIMELRVPHLGTPDRRFTYRVYLLNMQPRPLPLVMNSNVYKIDDKIISFL
jgi:CRISPR-associated protein Cas5h